jgi:hypothetical protein
MIFTIQILLIIGVVTIACSAIWLFKVYDLLPLLEEQTAKTIRFRIKMEHALMFIFIMGYLWAIYEVTHSHQEHFLIMAGGVFFLGSIYVLSSTYIKILMARAALNTIRGLIPICAKCKKVRTGEEAKNHEATWQAIDIYMTSKTGTKFSHGLCPDCLKEYEKDLEED